MAADMTIGIAQTAGDGAIQLGAGACARSEPRTSAGRGYRAEGRGLAGQKTRSPLQVLSVTNQLVR